MERAGAVAVRAPGPAHHAAKNVDAMTPGPLRAHDLLNASGVPRTPDGAPLPDWALAACRLGAPMVVRRAPRECVLLETDAPYLSPVPLRGKYPNEPARVALVAEKVAELWGETPAAVAAQTEKNARRAFPRLDGREAG